MSSLHLEAGSEKPAEIKGQGRLYSMKYCPFAHRIQLILTLKKIPHDIVNINLKNKPEWYFQIHPEGKTPAYIDADGTLVTDSVAIANYLNEKYPEPTLYCDKTKSRDLELLDHYSKITDTFSNCVHDKDKRQFEVIVAEIMGNLEEFEQELSIRQTPFFGGSNPGMLDILMWPWVECAKALPLVYKRPSGFNKDRFPKLMKWIVEMKNQPFVDEHKRSYEKIAKFIEVSRTENIDYDNI